MALQESINLPFIRLLRDLVRYSTYHGANNSAALLQDDADAQPGQRGKQQRAAQGGADGGGGLHRVLPAGGGMSCRHLRADRQGRAVGCRR